MSRDALIVGINSYSYSKLDDLTAPAIDAEAIAKQLESSPNPFRVTRLPAIKDKDNDALKTGKKTGVSFLELETALYNLFKPQGGNFTDTGLFYFSGHGLYRSISGEGYLATTDTNPDGNNWGFPFQRLQKLLRESKVRKQIIWLDCCHSGSLIVLNEANPEEQKDYSRCFIAAARDVESAFELASGSHGVLTEAILQGLNPDRMAGKWIDTLSLCAFVNQYLKDIRKTYPQRSLFLNVGEPIDLTRTEGAGTLESAIELQVDVCPYRALDAFDDNPEDVKVFFGRTALTDELLGKIYDGNFLAVLGASGSGKSSVVRAGLLSEIKKGERRSGTENWHILPIIKPTESPLRSLAGVFIPSEMRSKKKGEALLNASISDLIEKGASALVELMDEEEYEHPAVLVVDQFEEIFTLCRGSKEKDRERTQFLECLFGAVDTLQGKLRLVITMRADFLGKCLEQTDGDLAERVAGCRVDIKPISDKELDDVIEKPALQVGLRIAPDLRERMKAAVKESAGSLPLLQYALTELWKDWHTRYKAQVTTATEITIDRYEQIGSVEGALEKQANLVYESFADSTIKQGLVQRIFLELVQLGDETEDTRRRVRKRDLLSDIHSEDLVDEVLQKLVESRLVVTDELKAGEDMRSQSVIDLAHEATIRHWQLLKSWLHESRKDLPLIRQLRTEAERYQTEGGQGQSKHFLRGAKLEEAEVCLANYDEMGYFDPQTKNFIQLSKKTLVEEETEKEKQILEALTMTSEVLWNEGKPLGSLVAITKAGRRIQVSQFKPDNEIKVRAKLSQTLCSRIQERNRIEGHSSTILSVAFAPDGQTFASASMDNTVKLWSFAGELLLTLDYSEDVESVAFAPDGKTLASAGGDNAVRLWDLKGNLLQIFECNGYVRSVAFSADGRTIASGGSKNTVELWDIKGELLHTFSGHSNHVYSVAFSPDGHTIASASGDETVKLWDIKGELLHTFSGHSNHVYSVAFSPDGQTIASGGDSTVKLWDIKGELLHTFSGHSNHVYSVAFSPDGQTIASASGDGMVKLWDIKEELLHTFSGHSDGVFSVAFSPDGQILASASGSRDKTVRLWDLKAESLHFISLQDSLMDRFQRISEFKIAIAPDGLTIASANFGENTVKLWNLAGELLHTFSGYSDYVTNMAFAPDGKTIASASRDNIVKLWNVHDGTVKSWNVEGDLLQDFSSRHDYVTNMAFAPDGKTIASASRDNNTVKLWNLAGELLQDFSGSSVAFAPDGKTIASASRDNNTVKLWNLAGELLKNFTGHSDRVYSVAFAPDGKTIASASDDTVKLWNLAGELLKNFTGHRDGVANMAFAPDGKTIACASGRTVKLWNLAGELLQDLDFSGHRSSLSRVAFTLDGKTIASASGDGIVKLWNLDLDSLVAKSCEWLRDYLTHNPNVSASDRKLLDDINFLS